MFLHWVVLPGKVTFKAVLYSIFIARHLKTRIQSCHETLQEENEVLHHRFAKKQAFYKVPYAHYICTREIRPHARSSKKELLHLINQCLKQVLLKVSNVTQSSEHWRQFFFSITWNLSIKNDLMFRNWQHRYTNISFVFRLNLPCT